MHAVAVAAAAAVVLTQPNYKLNGGAAINHCANVCVDPMNPLSG